MTPKRMRQKAIERGIRDGLKPEDARLLWAFCKSGRSTPPWLIERMVTARDSNTDRSAE